MAAPASQRSSVTSPSSDSRSPSPCPWADCLLLRRVCATLHNAALRISTAPLWTPTRIEGLDAPILGSVEEASTVWIAHNAAVSIVRACAVALAATCQAIALLLPSARSIKTRLIITVLLKPTPRPTVFTTTATPALLLLGAHGRVHTAMWQTGRAPAPAAPTTPVSAVDGDKEDGKDKADGAKEDGKDKADGAKEDGKDRAKEDGKDKAKEALVKEDLRAAAR